MSFILLGILNAQAAGGASKYFLGILADPKKTVLRSVVGTSTNDFYLVGAWYEQNFTTFDYAVKLDETGATLWESRLTTGDGSAAAARLNSSGDLVVAGGYRSGGNPNQGYAKWQSDGTFVHYVNGGFPNVSNASNLAIDSSDNIYLAALESATDNRSACFIKLNSAGAFVLGSGRLFTNNVTCRGVAVVVNASGDIYLLLRQDSGGTSAITRFNSSGVRQQDVTFSIQGWNNMKEDSNGNLYLVTSSSGGHLMKLNSSMALQAQTKLGTASSTTFSKIFIDSSDNIYVTGLISGGTLVAKYDTSLNLVWQRKLSSVANPGELSVNSEGDLLVSGELTVSGVIQGFFGYLPADGSVTGTATLNGQAVELSVSTESVSTPTTTVSSASILGRGVYSSYAVRSNTPVDPNFTTYLENV